MVIPNVFMCYAIEASIILAGLEINSIGTSLNRSSHYWSKSYSVKPNKSKSPNAQCSKPSSLLSSFCYCNLYYLSVSSESTFANYFNNFSASCSASFFFLILNLNSSFSFNNLSLYSSSIFASLYLSFISNYSFIFFIFNFSFSS